LARGRLVLGVPTSGTGFCAPRPRAGHNGEGSTGGKRIPRSPSAGGDHLQVHAALPTLLAVNPGPGGKLGPVLAADGGPRERPRHNKPHVPRQADADP